MNQTAVDISAPGTPRIEYRGLSRMFTGGRNDFLAVEGIELTVEAGEFICIIGPSGCGKSTLLNMSAGLLTPSLGSVKYNGAAVRRLNTQVGYVTQRDMLLPWRTAAIFVMMLMGIGLTGVVILLERKLLSWKPARFNQ